MQEYIKTDQHIHLLSQVIAKANRTFVAKMPDDSHTNLHYDPVSNKVYGRWIHADVIKIILALDLNAYQFEIRDDRYKILYEYPIAGKTMFQLEEKISEGLKQIGLHTTGFSTPLHYQITDYPFKDDPFEILSDSGVQQWKKIRKLANETSLHVLGYLQTESEIRIWPHHFDTGVYAEVNADLAIGFGLAMADAMEPSPYFYLSGYALGKDELKFDDMPKLETGRWEINQYWKGAILPIDSLKSLDESKLTKAVYSFIVSAFIIYLG